MTQTVLITGAGIGIGRASAQAFAAAGHHVVVTNVLEAEGRSCVDEIRAAGGSAEFHHLDVRSTEAADALVARIEAERGGIDVIVANAGIAHKVPLPALTDEKWDHTFDIDLKGIFRVVRPALPGMRARGRGRSWRCPRSWAWPTAGTSMCITRPPSPGWWGWCAGWRSSWRATASA